jgi:hypothetical protein
MFIRAPALFSALKAGYRAQAFCTLLSQNFLRTCNILQSIQTTKFLLIWAHKRLSVQLDHQNHSISNRHNQSEHQIINTMNKLNQKLTNKLTKKQKRGCGRMWTGSVSASLSQLQFMKPQRCIAIVTTPADINTLGHSSLTTTAGT